MPTNLPGNPHFNAGNFAEIPAEPYAIAQATLALAYEQRTANLIDMYSALIANGQHAAAGKLREAIDGRMGL